MSRTGRSRGLILLGAALATASSAVSAQAWGQAAPVAVTQIPGGTEIKLMVLKEVNSHSARVGERFKLRVNEPIVVNGAVAIPVGATAWGEVTSVAGTGAAGGKGRLSARLLYVETAAGPLLISGQQGSEGKANTAGVVIGMLSFGLAGLLMKGGNALLKAGDILVGYVQPAKSETTPILVPMTATSVTTANH